MTAAAIIATITGADEAAANGMTVKSGSPVLALCRKLIEAGVDPAPPLLAYRGDTLALRVRSVGEAARLEVNHRGTGFVARCEGRPWPPMSFPGRAGVRHRARSEATP